MHDKPGVILVSNFLSDDELKKEIGDALDSGATYLYSTPTIAVFVHGYGGGKQ
jgi:hypothetical protein